MSNTSKSIAVILILLLIAAVIVGVCYSQGVFDALIPDDPGTGQCLESGFLLHHSS